MFNINKMKDYIKNISSLHVEPCGLVNIVKFKNILKEQKFFVLNNNLIIGINSEKELKNKKICLQAHLDHPAGVVNFIPDGYSLSVRFFGHSSVTNLLGRTFGFFIVGKKEPEFIEKAIQISKDDYSLIVHFILSEENKKLVKPNLIVHAINSDVNFDDNTMLSAWNLDDTLGVSLALMMYEKYSHDSIVILTRHEEIGNSSLESLLSMEEFKKITFINIDVCDKEYFNDLNMNEYCGIRKKHGKYNYENLPIYNEIINNIPYINQVIIQNGANEASVLYNKNISVIPYCLGITNYHNGIMKGYYTAETVEITTVEKAFNELNQILSFIISFSNKNNVEQFGETNKLQKMEDVFFEDFSEQIINCVVSANTYVEFLDIKSSKIMEIFQNLHLPLPQLNELNFEQLKKQLLKIDNKNILHKIENCYYLYNKIINIFMENNINITNHSKINIKSLLLGSFNAMTIFMENNATILLSVEHITEYDLNRILVHEMTHVISHNLFKNNVNNPIITRAVNEGLAIWMSKEILSISEAEACSMSNETFMFFTLHEKVIDIFMKRFISGHNLQK